MKQWKLLMLLFCVSFAGMALAQEDKSKRPSPPAVAEGSINGADIVIDYSSPSVKGRELYGNLIPAGSLWRTGANEATTFEVSKDVKIEGQELAAGKYALFTIGSPEEWTVIFNKVTDQWGHSKYDEAEDALRVKVAPMTAEEAVEKMAFKVGDDGKVHLMWGDIHVAFGVE